MNEFWGGLELKKERKEPLKNKKKTINIDGISNIGKKRQAQTVQKNIISDKKPITSKTSDLLNHNRSSKKNFKLWTAIILSIAFVFSLAFGGFWAVNASQNELNILKLFGNGKYLVLLQNNAEMRPSGGFIGSFAVVTLSGFQVKNIDFNSNIYKLDQAYMSQHVIAPPKPITTVSEKWTLHDANFTVSFPDSAKTIEWFYNQETGDNVDGVIAVNASVARDLLTMTGPITLNGYNTTITSDNFFTTLTTQIEQTYFQTSANRDLNEPKSILKDLMPVLVQKTLAQNKTELLRKLISEIKEKQILFYSNDSNIENSILAENWGGEVQTTNGDYLAINNANLGGGKSSLNIKESLSYKVTKADKNQVGNLTITRTHGGTNVWPDGVNKNYMRVLVPNGASIITASLNDKDITSTIATGDEAGKTYFALWTQTVPGTSDVINLQYNLPQSISTSNYQLLVQKQPGNLGDPLIVRYSDQLLFDGTLNQDQNLKS